MIEARISNHALGRYQLRVAPVGRAAAEDAIADLLRDARIRATPRHWMREATSYGSGVRFAYSARASGICLVLCGATVVTVVTRGTCRRTAPRRPERRYDRRQERRREGPKRFGGRDAGSGRDD